MYEEENWKNVKIKEDTLISDDGLYSKSISKKEIKKIADELNVKVKFHGFCDFATMAVLTKN